MVDILHEEIRDFMIRTFRSETKFHYNGRGNSGRRLKSILCIKILNVTETSASVSFKDFEGTPYVTSFRRRFFAYHHAMKHPH